MMATRERIAELKAMFHDGTLLDHFGMDSTGEPIDWDDDFTLWANFAFDRLAIPDIATYCMGPAAWE